MAGIERLRPVPGRSEKQVKPRPFRLARGFHRVSLRIFLSLLPPIVVALIQHLIWPLIEPHWWFFFYPAVFLSAWIGGVWGGIVSAGVSVVLVWWSFVPPVHILFKDEPYFLIPATVFFLMAIVFSLFQGRLKEAMERTRQALAEMRLSARKLREAYDQNAALITQASDGIFIADLDGRLLDVNETGCLMLGYSLEELIGQPLFSFIPPRDSERLDRAREKLLAGGFQIEEWSLLCKTGEWCAVEASAKILADGRWQIFLRDITARKQVEKHLQKVRRAKDALSKCNQALIRATDEASLLQQVCDVIVQDAGYVLCWVGRAEHDETKSVTVLAQSGLGADYLDNLHITWDDSERGRGPTGTCIRTMRVVTAADIAVDTAMAPWRQEALGHGYASSLAIPVMLGTETAGALMIYATEADAFQAEEMELLTELANDLAYGVSALRTRAERERAERELISLNAELEQRVLARTREVQTAREHEFEIGRRIQETLLVDPPPRRLPGVCIATLAEPSQRIDGDFIVFMEPRGGSFDVVVGDVMGKGIPAALLAAATKAHLLKALGQLFGTSADGRLPEPKDVVTITHADIVHQLISLDSFVTLCYARIDYVSGVIEIVDCGHTGTVQLHARTGTTQLLRGNNLPLGIRESEIYEQQSFSFEAGDMLLFFSDGITEARNSAGETFGPERLQECIRTHAQLEPDDLIHAIRNIVQDFCRSEYMADDMTIVAVRLDQVGRSVMQAEMIIKSDLRQLFKVREFVRSSCAGLPETLLDEDGVSKLELAVDETVSNIMKHAHGGQTNRKILIEAEAFAERIVFRLHHGGSVFQPKAVCLPQLNGSRQSGLGLYITSKCVDDVRYYRDADGSNCIALTKLFRKHSRNESEIPWKFQSRIGRT